MDSSAASSAFLFSNNHVAAAMNALQAASSGINEPRIPAQNFHSYPSFQPGGSFPNLQKTISNPSSATPFGINDILSRTSAAGDNIAPTRPPSPARSSVASASYFGNGHAQVTTPGAAFAAAAAMYLGTSSLGGTNSVTGSMLSQAHPARYSKPLAELPGRTPIYWPGVLQKDWQDKFVCQGKFEMCILIHNK